MPPPSRTVARAG
uniref:Uncharacterized protein n=1 Tax=Arundo donax TaxID=35708 RepID=A0A0A9ALG1_ARUDO